MRPCQPLLATSNAPLWHARSPQPGTKAPALALRQPKTATKFRKLRRKHRKWMEMDQKEKEKAQLSVTARVLMLVHWIALAKLQ